jgi:hypothetical protein
MTAEPRRDSQSLRLIEVAAVYSTEELEAWAARIVREEIADAEFDADGNARFQSQDTRPAPGITASIWTVDGHRVEPAASGTGIPQRPETHLGPSLMGMLYRSAGNPALRS